MILSFLRWLSRHESYFRFCVFILSLLPGCILFSDWIKNSLGFNPFEALMNRSGFWAVFFIILTLSLTPLRRWLGFLCKVCKLRFGKRLADWNFLIKSRRMMGLFGFFYASWHMLIYFHLELDWDAVFFIDDIADRAFVFYGFISWLLLLLLAITSPLFIRRHMGRQWRRLHRAMYLLSILVVVHALLEAKLGIVQPRVYAGIVSILLLHRVLVVIIKRWSRPDDTGLEAERR